MAKVSPLTRAFLEGRPLEAARVLEHVAPAPCATLLGSVPARVAIDVLQHMLPAHAARCLEFLKVPVAAGVLRTVAPQTGADMLRHLPEDTREILLSEMSANAALGLRTLLSYPEDSVGAWIDTRAPALPPDATAKEALDRVRRSTRESIDYLYVVSVDQHLLGVATLADVVRAPSRTPITEIMIQPTPRLSARTPLSAALAEPAWRDFHAIAAVDHQGRFVGALSQRTLVQARAHQAPPTSQLVVDTLGTVVNTYWFGVSSVLAAIAPWLAGGKLGGSPRGR